MAVVRLSARVENKEEFITFMPKMIESSELPSGKTVAVTHGENIAIRGSDHVISACYHEETDTRMLFHVQDALQQE